MSEDGDGLSASIQDLILIQKTSQEWRDQDKAMMIESRQRELEESIVIFRSLDWINKNYYVQLAEAQLKRLMEMMK